MTSIYDAYGELAESSGNEIVLTGRNIFHANQMQAVGDDVAEKLRLQSSDRLLEIGCNTGMILRLVAPLVTSAVGQDHPALLERFREIGAPENVEFVGGAWPETQPQGLFDKILVYSVVQLLPDATIADSFIDACIDRLNPGGLCLIGDMPNMDAGRRFMASTEGRKIAESYDELRESDIASDTTGDYARRDEVFASYTHPDNFIDDEYALKLLGRLRNKGLECYLLPQRDGLPFCYSREDVLIWKRA